jgi:hypothetical protein
MTIVSDQQRNIKFSDVMLAARGGVDGCAQASTAGRPRLAAITRLSRQPALSVAEKRILCGGPFEQGHDWP